MRRLAFLALALASLSACQSRADSLAEYRAQNERDKAEARDTALSDPATRDAIANDADAGYSADAN